MSRQPLKADLLLVLVTLLAAAGWMFSKEALAGLPPLLFIGMRFLLAGLVLGVAGWRPLAAMTAATRWRMLGIGVVMGGAMVFWVQGLYNATHVGEGAFIVSLGVILVPVVGRLFFGSRPSTTTWIALPIAIAGMAFLSLNNGFRLELAQLYFLIAAVIFAVHFNLNTLVVVKVPAVALTAGQLTVAGGINLLGSVVVEPWPAAVPAPIWGWLLASILIATSLRFFIQVYAQGLASASHAAIVMTLEPVWTALVAAFWLGEHMNALQGVGCGLIFTALVVQRIDVFMQARATAQAGG